MSSARAHFMPSKSGESRRAYASSGALHVRGDLESGKTWARLAMLTFIFNKLRSLNPSMRRGFLACCFACGAVLCARSARADIRSFVYTQESRTLAPGQSELEPWTTFRVGRLRYYSALDGRLELEHGLAQGLQL